MSKGFIFLLCGLVWLSSCQPKLQYRWDWREAHPSYHQIALSEVKTTGAELLDYTPKDYQRYCPEYPQLNREQRSLFWASLLSSIARHESSHNTESAYEEHIKNREGNFVVSRGLLQMSFESARFYNSELESPEELHDPRTNMRTGLLAIKKWVLADGVIAHQGKDGKWQGAARYWSTLRTNWKSEEIRSWLLGIDYSIVGGE